jgi:maltose alpha-D-glucosyltransferase/alpha-amylase
MADFAVGKKTYSAFKDSLASQLPGFLMHQRWFGGKARKIDSAEVIDVISVPADVTDSILLIAVVKYRDGGEETYAMPLVVVEGIGSRTQEVSHLLWAQIADDRQVALADGLKDERFLGALLDLIQLQSTVPGESGELRAVQTSLYPRLNPAPGSDLRARSVGAEQSNTSIIYGDRLILKFFRRIQEGINPDIEIGRFLTEKTSFTSVPALAGLLEYRSRDGKQMAQGMLQAFVANEGDAWSFTQRSLAEFYDILGTVKIESAGSAGMPTSLHVVVAPYLDAAELLGRRTAEMHLALASERTDPAFIPEPFTADFQRALEQSISGLTNRVFTQLQDSIPSRPPDQRAGAAQLASMRDEIARRIHTSLRMPIEAMRTRIHGDYHLGQVLRTSSDFVIIDFEGEPARPISERRIKRSPLQDVAGMLRSFHYAAFAPLLGDSKAFPNDVPRLSGWAEAWTRWVSERFLSGYFETAGSAPYLPQSADETKTILELHLLEKAVYELGYELNNRPAWLAIPLQGISQILSR